MGRFPMPKSSCLRLLHWSILTQVSKQILTILGCKISRWNRSESACGSSLIYILFGLKYILPFFTIDTVDMKYLLSRSIHTKAIDLLLSWSWDHFTALKLLLLFSSNTSRYANGYYDWKVFTTPKKCKLALIGSAAAFTKPILKTVYMILFVPNHSVTSFFITFVT